MASKPDLHIMSVPELLELRRDIDELVETKRESALAELRDEMVQKAELLGVGIEALVARRRKPKAANGAHA